MSTKNKGQDQQTASAKAGISERSGRRIEKGKIPRDDKAIRHWRTYKDPFKKVWENEVVPMLEQNFKLQPLTLFEHFAIKYPENFQNYALIAAHRFAATKITVEDRYVTMYKSGDLNEPGRGYAKGDSECQGTFKG